MLAVLRAVLNSVCFVHPPNKKSQNTEYPGRSVKGIIVKCPVFPRLSHQLAALQGRPVGT